jgi:hypothetical protein
MQTPCIDRTYLASRCSLAAWCDCHVCHRVSVLSWITTPYDSQRHSSQ